MASLPRQIEKRKQGLALPTSFPSQVCRQRSRRRSRQFDLSTNILSDDIAESLDISSPISSPHHDQGRYLLSGHTKGSISIYDLSPWGDSSQELDRDASDGGRFSRQSSQAQRGQSSWTLSNQRRSAARTYRPIQQGSVAGSGSILAVQWFPTDTGAFLSASTTGRVYVWDTQEMAVVLECRPFQFEERNHHQHQRGLSSRSRSLPQVIESSADLATNETSGCTLASMRMSPSLGSSLVAVSSPQTGTIKLVDLRSGSTSHSLLGHAQAGVSDVQWSPACPQYLLASAGREGCIRLWDIRKGGSLGTLTVLHQQGPTNKELQSVDDPFISRPYQSDGSHLRPRQNKRRTAGLVGPNDYSQVQGKHLTSASHQGPVTALTFDQESGHYLVSAGTDGEIYVWDLRKHSDQWIPRRFVSAHGGGPAGARHGRQVLATTIQYDHHRHDQEDWGTDTALWISQGSQLVRYSLEEGGQPRQILQGHLGPILAMTVAPSSCHEMPPPLYTSSTDGCILAWSVLPDHQGSETGAASRKRRDRDCW